MKITGFSKSGLFLMELIFVILFFALSGAICLQMFAYASQTATHAEELTQATLVARSAAECFQATDGALEDVAELLSGTATDTTVAITYDQDWQRGADTTSATYTLELVQQGTTADIAVYDMADGEPIYTLTVAIRQGGGL